MGGFQQECSQSYSPVARWITEVALTLTDESQQYGNIGETSVIARTPRTCLNIWAGDHICYHNGSELLRVYCTVQFHMWLFTQLSALTNSAKLLQSQLRVLFVASLWPCVKCQVAQIARSSFPRLKVSDL